MADDEGFRRYLQAGMAWFSVTQQKAEGILRDLTDSGEAAMGQAQKMFDRVVERSRQGSDELRELVRSEIREQVAALGLATKEDVARLEAKLDAAQAAASAPPSAPPPPSAAAAPPPPSAAAPRSKAPSAPGRRRTAPDKAAPITKSAPTTRAASSKGAAGTATVPKGRGPAGSAPGGGQSSGGGTAEKARGTRATTRAPSPPPRSSPEDA